MQKQLAAQESILTFAQIAPLAVLVIFTLIILIAIGIATVYLVRVIKNTGVGSTSVPQGGRSWLEYGSFFVVVFGIVAVIIGFLSILLFLGSFDDVTQAVGFLTAFFGAIVGLVGTFFGIKSSADATAGAQKLVAASGGDTTPPQVISTNPPDADENVPPNIHLTATFSKDMDSTTINPNTFKLLDQDTLQQVPPLVPSGVDYDETTKVATFNPAVVLEHGRRYGATITSGVKDKAGNALAQDKIWHFKVANGGEPTTEQEPTTEPRQEQPNDS
jgi:hypothetical protein